MVVGFGIPQVFWYAYGASLLGTFSTDPQSRMEYQNQKQIWSRRSIFSLSLDLCATEIESRA